MPYHKIIPPFMYEPLSALSKSNSLWLVGGAVRDHFLGVSSKDLDFAVAGDARNTARNIADVFGAHYFDLDSDRDAGRVILIDPEEGDWTLDFARLRGETIEQDLLGRDFTINALAISPDPEPKLIDITSGLQDIREAIIRACSRESFTADPVRILRMTRFAAKLGFTIDPATRQDARNATNKLPDVSKERIRDETFRIIAMPNITAGLRLLDHFEVLSQILPELGATKGLQQSPPHVFDVWSHSLAVVRHLEDILELLRADDVNSIARNLSLAEIALTLQPFRESLQNRMAMNSSGDRCFGQLLVFSALYHDTGKAATQTQDPDGRIRFLGHEAVSANFAIERAETLRLSRNEIRNISNVVRNHMRPAQLAKQQEISDRAIFRFMRSAGEASLDVILLSIADFLGKEIPPPNQRELSHRLEVMRRILDFYYTRQIGEIFADPLIRGDQLMHELGLSPGPIIGELLAYIREAQIVGDIHTKREAIRLARHAIERDE